MSGDVIVLAHGGGGHLSRELIRSQVLTRFGNGPLEGLPDAATLLINNGRRLVFSTDSFVVQPLVFPGGNIGDLAVYGTVNDIAVAGGRPRWLALSLILEEGLPLATLQIVLDSIQKAADACGVVIATGDTKVVPRGQADGLYVTTTGIGEGLDRLHLGTARIRAGDHVLVSGSLGDHGTAVMVAREEIRITHGPESDVGSVSRLVESVLPFGTAVRFMRDPTRGGAAAVLNEMVEERSLGLILWQRDIPFSPAARTVAELLGLDLLHVASEGRVILVCAPDVSTEILASWKDLPEGIGASRIGEVTEGTPRVVMETEIGGRRVIDLPQGELLPRIC